MFDPRNLPPWTMILNITASLKFPAQGPHTYVSRPTIGLFATGSELFVLNLVTMRWSTVALSGALNPSTIINAVAPTAFVADSARVLLGGHSRSNPYGPVIFSATIFIGNATTQTVNCSLEMDFVKSSNLTTVAAMTVSAVAVRPNSVGKVVAAGLDVGAYYDGDQPPYVWLSTDAGAHFRPLQVGLPNTIVSSMAWAPDGRLCVSSNGDGVTCIVISD
eukprot:COSAG01_NODE_1219_length_11174_cov_9.438555_13_plen_219_part_00